MNFVKSSTLEYYTQESMDLTDLLAITNYTLIVPHKSQHRFYQETILYQNQNKLSEKVGILSLLTL